MNELKVDLHTTEAISPTIFDKFPEILERGWTILREATVLYKIWVNLEMFWPNYLSYFSFMDKEPLFPLVNTSIIL